MKNTRSLLLRLGALVVSSVCLSAFAADAPAPVDSIAEAFGQGKVSLNVRARYEGVEQTALKDADAYTIRTRLGFTTAAIAGFKAMIEAENITAIDGDRYSQAGLNAGGAGRAVVADPEGSEINHAWLAYVSGKTTTTLGRQRLVLDNTRFIGDVGWRQNAQTFDAITLTSQAIDRVNITYSYLHRINRVFSDRHPQGNWQSDSHVMNAGYAGLPIGTLTGYAYLLDFDNAAVNSSATVGASLTGTPTLQDSLKLSYRTEYARQSGYGSSPLSYAADYYLGELGLVAKPGSIGAGYEVLGTDNGVGFKTPLATLHAFNGWADIFLNTPAGGLRDTYVKAGAALPRGIGLLAFFHRFETDTGMDLGEEWDVQLTRKFGKYFTGVLKYADFNRDSLTVPNVQKLWVQAEFNY
ncbi:MAG TPA: alginate export family protein [Opitutus sp.]|nr:alginate export family protein [Opitutus sp.]